MKKGRQAVPLPLQLENPPTSSGPFENSSASSWGRSGETSAAMAASTTSPSAISSTTTATTTTTTTTSSTTAQISPPPSSSSLSPRWFPRKSPIEQHQHGHVEKGHSHEPLNEAATATTTTTTTSTTPVLQLPPLDQANNSPRLVRPQSQYEPQKLRKQPPPHIQRQLLQQQHDDANTLPAATPQRHEACPTISTTFYDQQSSSSAIDIATQPQQQRPFSHLPSPRSFSHLPSSPSPHRRSASPLALPSPLPSPLASPLPSPSLPRHLVHHPHAPHHQHSLSSPQPFVRDSDDVGASSTTRRIRSGLFSFGRDKDKKSGLVYGYGSMSSRSETSMSRDSSTQVDQTLHNPYSTSRPSRSDLSLSSAGEGFDGQRSNNQRRGKTKPFHILSRSKNSSRDGEIHSPSCDKNADTIRIVEPDYDNLSATSVSAPASRAGSIGQSGLDSAAQQRSLRTKMTSAARNRSEDRGPPASSSSNGTSSNNNIPTPSNNHHHGLKEHSRHQSSAPREPFFAHFLKNGPAAKAADMIGKGLFGKGGWSGNTAAEPAKETTVADEDYEIKVINLPLVEQTRKTRISPRLETSRDKTEFWMPAIAWRAIDYLNYKGSDVEGLYRVPGSGQQVKRWQRKFDEEYDVDLFEQDDLYDINIIGSMLKAWLRELPDELLPKSIQDRVSRECQGATEVPQLLIDELSNLPPFNYYLLFAITCHLSLLLAHQDKNKMSYPNLCICFQPCMKIDAFCFKFLVQDWRKCWKGCRNEARYIEEEYALFDLPPPRGLAEPRQPRTEKEDSSEQPPPSSSSTSAAPAQLKGEDGPLKNSGAASSDVKQAPSSSSKNKAGFSSNNNNNHSRAPVVPNSNNNSSNTSTLKASAAPATPQSRAPARTTHSPTSPSGSSAAASGPTPPAPVILAPIPTITGPSSPSEGGSLLKNRMAKKRENTPTLEQNATFDEVPAPMLTINSDRNLPVRAKPSLPHLQISPIAPLSPFSL